MVKNYPMSKRELIFNQLLLVFALLVFLSAPAIAQEDPATCHAIVTDYKTVQSMLKSGQINQRTYQSELQKLEARASIQSIKENYDTRKAEGRLRPGETIMEHANDKFFLQPTCQSEEEYFLFDKILHGFTKELTWIYLTLFFFRLFPACPLKIVSHPGN